MTSDTIRTTKEVLEELLFAKKVSPHTQNIVVADGLALLDESRLVVRTLQNGSTAPVYVNVGSPANANQFQFILAACVSQDDGTSPVLDLSSIRGNIYVASNGGSVRVAAYQARLI